MIYSGAGVVTTAGTAVRLASESVPCTQIKIKAGKASGATNTGVVYVGGSSVSATTGYPLTTGQTLEIGPVETDSLNLMDVWIDAATNADGVLYLYVVR